jgi:hypothetical protein
MDRDERVLRGRIGGLTTRARHDPTTNTAAARAAFLARFEREVDPDGMLTPVERDRRVDAALRAHFSRMGLESVQARRRRREAAADAERATVLDALIAAQGHEGGADGT